MDETLKRIKNGEGISSRVINRDSFINGYEIYYTISEREKYKDKLLYDTNFNNTISYLLNTKEIDAEIVVSVISNLCDIIKEKNKELL